MVFELVETDALGFEVTRRLSLGEGVQPTWVTRPDREGRIFVTGNNVAKLFEVDLDSWRVVRTFRHGSWTVQRRSDIGWIGPRRDLQGRGSRRVLGCRRRYGAGTRRDDSNNPARSGGDAGWAIRLRNARGGR